MGAVQCMIQWVDDSDSSVFISRLCNACFLSRNDRFSLNHFIITFIPPPLHHLHRPYHPHLLCKQLCVSSSRDLRLPQRDSQTDRLNTLQTLIFTSSNVLHQLELMHCFSVIIYQNTFSIIIITSSFHIILAARKTERCD